MASASYQIPNYQQARRQVLDQANTAASSPGNLQQSGLKQNNPQVPQPSASVLQSYAAKRNPAGLDNFTSAFNAQKVLTDQKFQDQLNAQAAKRGIAADPAGLRFLTLGMADKNASDAATLAQHQKDFYTLDAENQARMEQLRLSGQLNKDLQSSGIRDETSAQKELARLQMQLALEQDRGLARQSLSSFRDATNLYNSLYPENDTGVPSLPSGGGGMGEVMSAGDEEGFGKPGRLLSHQSPPKKETVYTETAAQAAERRKALQAQRDAYNQSVHTQGPSARNWQPPTNAPSNAPNSQPSYGESVGRGVGDTLASAWE